MFLLSANTAQASRSRLPFINWAAVVENLSHRLDRAFERDSQIDGLIGPQLTSLLLVTGLAYERLGNRQNAAKLIAQAVMFTVNLPLEELGEAILRSWGYIDIVPL